MAWVVRMPDGSDSEPFETAAEAEAFADRITEHHGRTPAEVYAGEAKPRVKRDVFLRRMAMGWKPHRALHTSLAGQYLGVFRSAVAKLDAEIGGRNAEYHEMWGRKRTIKDWSLSSGRTESAIRNGIARHGSLEKYFNHVGWYPTKRANIIDLTDDDLFS